MGKLWLEVSTMYKLMYLFWTLRNLWSPAYRSDLRYCVLYETLVEAHCKLLCRLFDVEKARVELIKDKTVWSNIAVRWSSYCQKKRLIKGYRNLSSIKLFLPKALRLKILFKVNKNLFSNSVCEILSEIKLPASCRCLSSFHKVRLLLLLLP